jgi:hypothetical protein
MIPSLAPGRVTPLKNKTTSRTYGNVAVKYTTFPDDSTPGNTNVTTPKSSVE